MNRFSHAYFMVTIYNSRNLSDVYYLYPSSSVMKIGNKDNKNYPFLEGGQIEVNHQNVSKIDFSINIPYDFAIKMLDSPMFWAGNIVTAKIGYYGDDKYSSVFTGLIDKGGAGLNLTPNGLSGSITAVPINSGVLFPVSKKIKKSISIFNLIDLLRVDMGMKFAYTDDVAEVLKKYYIGLIPDTMSILDALYLSIRRAGCDYVMTYDKQGNAVLNIDKIGTARFTKYVKTFRLRGQIDLNNNIYPIANYKPQDTLVLFTPSGGVKMNYLNNKGKMVNIEVVDNKKVSDKTGIDKGQVNIGKQDKRQSVENATVKTDTKEPTKGAKKVIANARKSEQQNKIRAEAVHIKRKNEKVIKATIDTIGVPDLIPNEHIKVTGCGDLFNGDYSITKINHSFSGGVFSTSIECIRTDNYSGKVKVKK